MHSLSDKLVVFVGGESPTKGYLFLALVLFITILIAITVAGPSHDPREPPLIRPRLPVFGHLLGLVRNRVSYFNDVFDEHGLPIATLPIVNKKLYVIFSAPIQQNAMRAKTMDAQSLTVEFIPRLFGVRKKTLDMLLGRDGIHEDMTPSMLKVFQTTLAPGCQPLNKMTSNALVQVAKALNEIDAEGIRIPNLFMWLRSMMSYAVSTGLFGHQHNPYGHGLEIIDAQWDFEAGLGPLVVGVLPTVIARTAYFARQKVADALRPFYKAELDQHDEASELVKARARLFRKWGVPLDDLSRNEVSVMLAATTNTIPTLFWYIVHVWLRPELVEEIRREVSQTVTCLHDEKGAILTPISGIKKITINFTKLDANCPLLGGSYREAVRLASQILTLRRVLADTIVSDGKGGPSYLLKAGSNVMMPAKVVHRNTDTWGKDADQFNPRRFLPDPSGDKDLDRLRKISFVPFGGGKHYCPGRHFAFAENLAFMAALVLGFEVIGLDEKKVRMRDSKMGEAAKPVPGFEGGPVVIRRRKGWEAVEWSFAV